MPTSDPGSSAAAGGARAAGHGFTLIELLIVIAIVALGAAVMSLALRDRDEARLEEEAARLAALLESARTEARAAGLPVRWVPAQAADAAGADDGTGFRFVGLPAAFALPTRWLEPRVSAQVVGAAALVLGPDAILPPQRVVLALDERRLEVGSDGLGPFAVRPPAEPAEGARADGR
jgi:general secretion pathway protein H